MNVSTKTGIFAGVALLLLLGAIVLHPTEPDAELASDTDKPFFPAFTNPADCREIQVEEANPKSGAVSRFNVKFTDKGWIIPSHQNFPVDKQNQVAEIAGQFIGLKKEQIVSESAADHDKYGLNAPDSQSPADSRGRLIEFKDATGQTLAKFIVGRQPEEAYGKRYVRLPESPRCYQVTLNLTLSTKFQDWVQTDILELGAQQIKGITLNNYRIQGGFLSANVSARETLVLSRQDKDWLLEGLNSETEELDTEKLKSSVLRTIDLLKIYDVQPRIEDLRKFIEEGKIRPTPDSTSQAFVESSFLHFANGFWRGDPKPGAADPRPCLMGEEGEIRVHHEDALRYTLRFGKPVMRQDVDHDTGTTSEKEYIHLMVVVDYDASLSPEPTLPPKPEDYVAREERDAVDAEGNPKYPNEQKKRSADWDKANNTLEADKKKWKTTLENAEKKAQRLNERYAGWIYLVPADEFRQIRLNRADLVRAKAPKVEPIPGQWITLPSGLQYMDEVIGTGAEVMDGDRVKAKYRGTLNDGTQFDSNWNGEREPFGFTAGATKGSGAIRGWLEGVPGMRVGGIRKLKIPAAMAYGAQARPGIPANSDLNFDVEVVEIESGS